MPQPLRVLILEDRPDDAELMVAALRRAGYTPDWARVDTVPDYLAQLEATPEVILADYLLPQFDALLALHLLQVREMDIPFIIVTGSLSEEVAVECMKHGAVDYLLKDRLARLGASVAQALEKKRLRDAQRNTEIALRESELRFRQLVESVKDYAIFMLDASGRVVTWNPGAQRITGYWADEIVGHHYRTFFETETAAAQQPESDLRETATAGRLHRECSWVRRDGSCFPADVVLTALHDPLGHLSGYANVTRDAGERPAALASPLRELCDAVQHLAKLSVGLDGEAKDCLDRAVDAERALRDLLAKSDTGAR